MKRRIGKKKMSKKAFYRRRRIKRIRALLFILFVVLSIVALTKIFYLRQVSIGTSSINYYITLADSSSRNRGQLNWKEIAAIDAATHDEKFENSDENTVQVISNYFYEGDSNTVVDFESALDNANLSRKQKNRARKILEDLDDVSLRVKYEGENRNKDEFIQRLSKPCIENYKKYGVLPSISMAQAILESSWGTSELAREYNNYYGIKASSAWTGPVINFSTQENYNDTIKANFRVYSSLDESVYDLGQFLKNNSRYTENGLFTAKNYIEQANALENAGYATVKNETGEAIYADMLIDIIRENNLMIYDMRL